MKKLYMVLPLVFLLCFTFGCQQGEEVAEEPVVDLDAEKEGVLAVNAEFLEAVKVGKEKVFYLELAYFHQKIKNCLFFKRN